MFTLPPLNQVDYYDEFHSYINTMLSRYPDRPAITVYDRQGTPVTHSYQQFCTDIKLFAAALYQKDPHPRHIAIIAENSYEWLVVAFGTVYAGNVIVCIDAEQSEEVIQRMVTAADCKEVYCSEYYVPMLSSLSTVAVTALEHKSNGFVAMLAKAESDTAAQTAVEDMQLDPLATAFIYYTSGTTSTSKAVMLSQKAILYNAIDSLALVKVSGKMFACLPFYHTYSLSGSIVNVLSIGMHICVNGNLRTAMRDLALFAPDVVLGVPLVVENIYKLILHTINKAGKMAEAEEYFRKKATHFPVTVTDRPNPFQAYTDQVCGPHLRLMLCGGAHVSENLLLRMESLNIHVLQGYGITECAPLVSVNRDCINKIGSMGRVFPHYQVKIVDEEILVKGTSLMNGYYKNPELTAEVFSDGWFKTGDIGYLDKQGFLYITGRKKNLIVFKNGKKTSPEEIEQLLYDIPLVKEVLAHGAQSGATADDVQLTVTIYCDPEKTRDMTSYEILEILQKEIDRINLKLPSYKQIRMVKITENPLNKTSMNKIKRN